MKQIFIFNYLTLIDVFFVLWAFWFIKKWIGTFITVKMALTFKVHRNIWLTEGTLYASWNGFCYFTENSSKYCVEHLLLKDNRFFYVYHQFHWHRNAQEHMVHSILSQPFYVSMETLFFAVNWCRSTKMCTNNQLSDLLL